MLALIYVTSSKLIYNYIALFCSLYRELETYQYSKNPDDPTEPSLSIKLLEGNPEDLISVKHALKAWGFIWQCYAGK